MNKGEKQTFPVSTLDQYLHGSSIQPGVTSLDDISALYNLLVICLSVASECSLTFSAIM